MKRDKILQGLNSKFYHEEILMKPKVNKIIMSIVRSTNVVTFSIKETILRMVTNKSLFTPKNLLLNPKDPFIDPPESAHYGEINSSSWFKEAK